MNHFKFGNCVACCTPTVNRSYATLTEDGYALVIEWTPCEPAPINDYFVQYRIKDSGGTWIIVGPYDTYSNPIIILTGDPVGTQYEGYFYSDCGNGNLGQVAFTTITTNCIFQSYNTESIGYAVFICAQASMSPTSDVHVVLQLTTGDAFDVTYEVYFREVIITAGKAYPFKSCVKVLYSRPDEHLIGLTIFSITPASDSTFQYVECS